MEFYYNVNYMMKKKYMYTKTNNTIDSKKQAVALELIDDIKKTIASYVSSENYDSGIPLKQQFILFILDDDAMTYIGFKEDISALGVGIVFIGLNQLLSVYNQKYNFLTGSDLKIPTKNITGVYERAYSVEAFVIMSLFLKGLENTTSTEKNIVFGIFDNSTSGILTKEQTLLEYEEQKYMVENLLNIKYITVTVDTFTEYQKAIYYANNNESIKAIYFSSTSLKPDSENPHTSNFVVSEIASWTRKNSKKPEISIGPAYCSLGLLGGKGVSMVGMGKIGGRMVGKILKGENFSNVPIEYYPENCFFLNYGRAKDLSKLIDWSSLNLLLPYVDYLYEDTNNDLLIGLIVGFSSLFVVFLIVFLIVLLILMIVCYTNAFLQKKQKALEGIDLERILLEKNSHSGSKHSNTNRISTDLNENIFRVNKNDIKLIRVIGQGNGESVVYEILWKNQKCAFKCYNNSLFANGMDECFSSEVNLMSTLSHPNILQFFGVCFDPMRHGIVIELCAKGDLESFIVNQRLLESPVPLQQKFTFLSGIIDGMEYLHDRKIIHRDLKPQNILLTHELNVKIIDFGLSRKTRSDVSKKTVKVGTSFYMAPEILKGNGTYTSKVDVFSFAIIMFEVLTDNFMPYDSIAEEGSYGIEFKVANDNNFRPVVPKHLDENENLWWIVEHMKIAWDENPLKRPDFHQLKESFSINLKKN